MTLTRSPRPFVVLLMLSAALVMLAYWPTLSRDVMLDDYVALRPRAGSELLRVWHESWEPRGLWPAFYRPLSIWYYSLLFHLFGLAAVPLRLITLIEVAIAAACLGVFVRRETDSNSAAAFGALLFAVHPALAASGVLFIFLQNHLMSVLATLCALLMWQARRQTPTMRAWWPIGVVILSGALIKEDVLMVAPILIVLQLVRARTIGDVPAPGWKLTGAMAAAVGAVFAARYAMLGELGGLIELPAAGGLIRNALRPAVQTLAQYRGIYFENAWSLRVASMMSIAWLLAGLATARRFDRARSLWLSAAAVIILFTAPLVLMNSAWRNHLVAIGATLLTTASVAGVLCAAGRGVWRVPAIGCAALTILAMAFASRAIGAPFDPRGSGERSLDRELIEDGGFAPDTAGVRTHWQLPPEELEWLASKTSAVRDGRILRFTDDVDVVTWDLDARSFTSLVNLRARSLHITVRAPDATAARPTRIRVNVNGREAMTLSVESPSATVEFTVPLESEALTLLTRLRRMHRVDVATTGRGVALERRSVRVER